MGWESFDVVTFGLGPLLQDQTRTAKLKNVYNSLIIDPRGLQYETNLQEIMWSDFTLSPSFKVKRVLITRLLLILEVCNVKPTCRKSWSGNLLMLSDLTFGPSFKGNRWFTGFGELSLHWLSHV